MRASVYPAVRGRASKSSTTLHTVGVSYLRSKFRISADMMPSFFATDEHISVFLYDPNSSVAVFIRVYLWQIFHDSRPKPRTGRLRLVGRVQYFHCGQFRDFDRLGGLAFH